MTKKIAVFAGSFDPVTRGHESIVNTACNIFDQIIVAVGNNTTKNALFPTEKKIDLLKTIFNGNDKVSILPFNGLTIDFCKSQNALFMIRGLRSTADFEYEKSIAHMNKTMAPEIETIFIITEPQLSAVSSTIVREILRSGGDVSQFVPRSIKDALIV
jgi:pantetheine-phosphate adenylyltransferase